MIEFTFLSKQSTLLFAKSILYKVMYATNIVVNNIVEDMDRLDTVRSFQNELHCSPNKNQSGFTEQYNNTNNNIYLFSVT